MEFHLQTNRLHVVLSLILSKRCYLLPACEFMACTTTSPLLSCESTFFCLQKLIVASVGTILSLIKIIREVANRTVLHGVASPSFWLITLGNKISLFFFGTRGKMSNPNRAFNAEFKYVSSFSPSPTFFL